MGEDAVKPLAVVDQRHLRFRVWWCAIWLAMMVAAAGDQQVVLSGGPRRAIATVLDVRRTDGRLVPFRVDQAPPGKVEVQLVRRVLTPSEAGTIQTILAPIDQTSFLQTLPFKLNTGRQHEFEFRDIQSVLSELDPPVGSDSTVPVECFRLVFVASNQWQDVGQPFRVEILDEPSVSNRSYNQERMAESIPGAPQTAGTPDYSRVKSTVLHKAKLPTISHLVMAQEAQNSMPASLVIPVFGPGSKNIEWNAIRKGIAAVNGFVYETNHPLDRLVPEELIRASQDIVRNAVVVSIPTLGPEVIQKRGQPDTLQYPTVSITYRDTRGKTVRVERIVR